MYLGPANRGALFAGSCFSYGHTSGNGGFYTRYHPEYKPDYLQICIRGFEETQCFSRVPPSPPPLEESIAYSGQTGGAATPPSSLARCDAPIGAVRNAHDGHQHPHAERAFDGNRSTSWSGWLNASSAGVARVTATLARPDARVCGVRFVVLDASLRPDYATVRCRASNGGDGGWTTFATSFVNAGTTSVVVDASHDLPCAELELQLHRLDRAADDRAFAIADVDVYTRG